MFSCVYIVKRPVVKCPCLRLKGRATDCGRAELRLPFFKVLQSIFRHNYGEIPLKSGEIPVHLWWSVLKNGTPTKSQNSAFSQGTDREFHEPGFWNFSAQFLARIRRLRKSPQFLLVTLQLKMTVSAKIFAILRKTSKRNAQKETRQDPGSRHSLGTGGIQCDLFYYVYVCIYIYIYIYIYMCMYICMYISLYIYIYMYLSLSLYIYIYIYADVAWRDVTWHDSSWHDTASSSKPDKRDLRQGLRKLYKYVLWFHCFCNENNKETEQHNNQKKANRKHVNVYVTNRWNGLNIE